MVLEPLNSVELYARSFAEEAWLLALADLHQLLQRTPQARIIGGTMVTLHVHRWRLADQMERLTLDNDLGVDHSVVIYGTITEDLARIGYTKTSGGHYERATELPTDDHQAQPTAVIDLLVPAYTSRARQNIRVGDIFTTEVLGLAEALQESGVRIAATLKGRTGWTSDIVVTVPSEAAALALKAMAWKARMLALKQAKKSDEYANDEKFHEKNYLVLKPASPDTPARSRRWPARKRNVSCDMTLPPVSRVVFAGKDSN